MAITITTLNAPEQDIEWTDALVELDRKVRQNNQAPYLYRQNRDFYFDNLKGRAVNVLALAHEKVVGYASLKTMIPWPGYLEQMPYPAEQCAMLQYVMVDPDYRGQKLGQKMQRKRIEAALALGCRYLFATVHPDNQVSVKSLQQLGFSVIAQRPMFTEQLLRNLMFLDVKAHQATWAPASSAI